jgi:hypothetical protein
MKVLQNQTANGTMEQEQAGASRTGQLDNFA